LVTDMTSGGGPYDAHTNRRSGQEGGYTADV